MKYDIIIFDADDTLFDFKKSEKEAFKNAMMEFKFNYEEDYHLNIYKEINRAIWKEFEDGLITQKELKVERFKRLSKKLEVEFDVDLFAKTYMKHLSYASFLFEDSISIVENLYEKYRLLIITNGLTDVQENRIRKSEIAKYFEAIIISEEAKVSKPDPEIFEIALKNIESVDKSKILMVGDSLTSDIQGGINYGIDTCWFNLYGHENKKNIKPTYEISQLMDLYKVLE